MSIEIECLHPGPDRFGESPLWDPRAEALWWVDVTAPALQCFDPATRTVDRFAMPEDIGSIGLRRAGGLVAGMRSGLWALDPAGGGRRLLAAPPGEDGTRFNDGKCDRAGRFWSGTLDDRSFAAVGNLYRLDPDGGCRRMAEGFILVNGIAWSPDDRTMYVADSRREVVYAYDFDLASGTLGARRAFISTEDIPGRVDGATVDRDGCYWCAHVRGGEVAQYDPDGRRMRRIALPVRYPLMCSFGGPALDLLYVTSSAALVTAEEAAQQPLAGALFAIHGTGAAGLPEPEFAG
jgi:sugar lactone lactonase YvrE